MLTIPRSKLKTKGYRAFVVKAPTLWSSLPDEIRLAESVPSFTT